MKSCIVGTVCLLSIIATSALRDGLGLSSNFEMIPKIYFVVHFAWWDTHDNIIIAYICDSQILPTGGFSSLSVWYEWNFANKVTEANDAQNIKEPHLGWIIGFMFLLATLDRRGVDRRVFCETYLSLSLSSTIPARPRSATETAHRQRRVVQYGDDGVVVLVASGDGDILAVARMLA